jgi:hypothetical protein
MFWWFTNKTLKRQITLAVLLVDSTLRFEQRNWLASSKCNLISNIPNINACVRGRLSLPKENCPYLLPKFFGAPFLTNMFDVITIVVLANYEFTGEGYIRLSAVLISLWCDQTLLSRVSPRWFLWGHVVSWLIMKASVIHLVASSCMDWC